MTWSLHAKNAGALRNILSKARGGAEAGAKVGGANKDAAAISTQPSPSRCPSHLWEVVLTMLSLGGSISAGIHVNNLGSWQICYAPCSNVCPMMPVYIHTTPHSMQVSLGRGSQPGSTGPARWHHVQPTALDDERGDCRSSRWDGV